MTSANAPPMYDTLPAAPPYELQSHPHHPPTTNTMVSVTVPSRAAGSCPVCRNDDWTGTYSCFAWLLCFFCFWNCGLCCCLCMRKKKCTKCGFTIA